MSRKPKTLEFWWGRLPHWEVEGGRYFITLHLAGAIPAPGRRVLREVAKEFRQASDRHGHGWLQVQRAIFAEMERWLDRSEWNPQLRQPEIARIVIEAIEHRQQRGDWVVHEYVVMPTHLHLFCEFGARGMKAVMEDFKRWTGHQALALLNRTAVRFKRFWQREWFDHWSRSDEEDDRIMIYIRKNPEKSGLIENYLLWPYGSWGDGTER
jgi:REP element-mobilizing transposase RayT